MRGRGSTGWVFFFAGIAAGAAVGFILTPVSGVEARRVLGRKADQARNFVAESGSEYVDRGRELYEQGLKLADQAAEMFEQGRKLMEGEEA
ncbi:MAG TPA: hypothetical protein VEQ63_02270 [Bryobacteraceae bacterium]|nr:hypothetical protein [Bryobacteraceae bacterium]